MKYKDEQYTKLVKEIKDDKVVCEIYNKYEDFAANNQIDIVLIYYNIKEKYDFRDKELLYFLFKMVLRLNELIKSKKVTRKELEKEYIVDQAALSNYLNGTRIMPVYTLFKMKRKFNVSMDYLLGIEDIETPVLEERLICKETKLNDKSLKKLRELYKENEMLNPLYEFIVNTLIENEYFSDIVRRLLLMCINANIDTLTETESKYAKARKALFMGDVDEYHFWKCRQDLYEIIVDIANNINNNRYLIEKLMPLVYTGYNEFKEKAGDK